MRTWTYPSKSSPGTTYTVVQADNHLLGCDCRGWTMKKPGKERRCTHVDDVIKKHGLDVEVRNDYVFVKESTESVLTSPANENIITPMANMVMAATDLMAAQRASAMLVPVTGAAFDAKYGGGDWTMDEKMDGHRFVVIKRGTQINASSHGADPNGAKVVPAHVLAGLQQLPDGIYDGELIVPGGASWDVTNLALQGQIKAVFFDVLEILGESTLTFPQEVRRQLLAQALAHVSGDAVLLVAEFTPTWAKVLEIWARGGEGVILKKTSAPYKLGYRTDAWVKVKKLQHMVGVVTGFEAGSFGPHSVTILTMSNGSPCRVKTLDTPTLKAIALDPATYIGRRLVIQYQQLTPSGQLRHPMFDHWAGDHE